MKIVINTAHQRFGGGVQVAISFIEECKKFHSHEYHIWLGPGVRSSIDKNSFPKNFIFYDLDFGVIGFTSLLKIQRALKALENEILPDVIISTSGPTYFHSCAPQIIGFNLPLYIYPESPYVNNLKLSKRLKLNLKKLVHTYFFLRDASAYVVQTDDVNKRVRKLLNSDNVYTVTNNFNSYFVNPKSFSNKLPPKKEGELRFLTVSSYYPHKGLEIIPKVSDEMVKRGFENFSFVLTLEESHFTENFEKNSSIVSVGPVKPSECPSLYKECDFMFLPTLAECFSASYPEAMKMGIPIITTNLGFAKSICGDAAMYFEPMNHISAADIIQKIIEDKPLQVSLIKNGYRRLKLFDSPLARAEKYLNICDKALHSKQI